MELQPEVFVDVTPTLDTNAYADGDVLFNPTEMVGALKYPEGKAYAVSFQINDEDDTGGAFDLYILNAANNLGTLNSPPNISDANARAIVGGPWTVGAGDFRDLGGVRVARIPGEFHLMRGAAGAGGNAGSTSLWLAAIGRDAKTYTAAGLKIKVGFGY